MAQVALNTAPGSTDSLPMTTSPLMSAVVLSERIWSTINFPEKVPSISAFVQSMVPET